MRSDVTAPRYKSSLVRAAQVAEFCHNQTQTHHLATLEIRMLATPHAHYETWHTVHRCCIRGRGWILGRVIFRERLGWVEVEVERFPWFLFSPNNTIHQCVEGGARPALWKWGFLCLPAAGMVERGAGAGHWLAPVTRRH